MFMDESSDTISIIPTFNNDVIMIYLYFNIQNILYNMTT